MTKLINNLIKISFFTVLTQLLLILFSPIFTRIYSPESIGVLALYTTITSIIGSICCLRLELAIPLPESDEDGFQIFFLTIIISLLISSILFILIKFFESFIIQSPYFQPLSDLIFYIPFTIFFVGFLSATNYLFIRKELFAITAVSSFIIALITIFLQISLPFYLTSQSFILVLGKNVGMIAGIIFIIIFLAKNRSINIRLNLKKITELCFRFKNFVIFDIPATLLLSLIHI